MELLRESIPLHATTTATYPTQSGRELQDKIRQRSAQAGVVGLGYVGLPLGLAFADAGFQVHGIDVDQLLADLNATIIARN